MVSFNVLAVLVVLGFIAVTNTNPVPEPEPEPALLLADGFRPAGNPDFEDIGLGHGLYKPRHAGSHYRSKYPVIDPGYFANHENGNYRSKYPVIDPGYFANPRLYDNGIFPGFGFYGGNRHFVY